MHLNYYYVKMSGTGSEYLISNPKKSFFESKHTQYFDVLSRKKIYNFENDRLVLPSDTDLEKIDKMWISNVNNVKCISMFLVLSETIDINTIATDTKTMSTNADYSGYNIDCFDANEDYSGYDIDCFNTNADISSSNYNCLHILFRLTNSAIATYNSLHSDGKYLNALPCVSGLGIMPSRYNFGKTRVLIVIERYDQNVQTDLTIKYLISNNFDEKRRIFQSYHETLVRKYISYQHNCVTGSNKIMVDCPNRCMYYVMINSTNNPTIKFTCKTFDNQREKTTIKQDILSTKIDEEFKYLSINNDEYTFNTYILDAYMNTQHSNYEPTGIIEIRNGSYFDIICEFDSQVTITYCLHDVLRTTWGADLIYN